MPTFATGADQTGTVTDPVWGDVVTILFVAIAVVVIAVAIGSLVVEFIRRWREVDAQLDATIAQVLDTGRDRPLPAGSWRTDPEAPIGNQLLREYIGGGLR